MSTTISSISREKSSLFRYLRWFVVLTSDTALLFVILIVGIVVWLFSKAPVNQWPALLRLNDNNTQVVRLNIQDANSLSPGNPVRFLGVRVGVVQDVWADQQGAHVRLKLNASAPLIPYGARATISEFGLAGTRSIEFEPPKDTVYKAPGSDPLQATVSPFAFEEPRRTTENLAFQGEVAKVLKDGADALRTGLFSTPVPQLQAEIAKVRQGSQHSLEQLDHFKGYMPRYGRQTAFLRQEMKAFVSLLQQSNEQSAVILQQLKDPHSKLRADWRQLNEDIAALREMLQSGGALAELGKLSDGLERLGQQAEKADTQLEQLKPLLYQQMAELDASLQSADTQLQQAESKVSKATQKLEPKLNEIQADLKRFNNTIEQINAAIER